MSSSHTVTAPSALNFEMQWPGLQRWEILMEQFREHVMGLEEWFEVKRQGSGELGICPPPKSMSMSMDDYEQPRQPAERGTGIGFTSGWTLLTS